VYFVFLCITVVRSPEGAYIFSGLGQDDTVESNKAAKGPRGGKWVPPWDRDGDVWCTSFSSSLHSIEMIYQKYWVCLTSRRFLKLKKYAKTGKPIPQS
jgi:hypothetical protein